MDEVMTIKNLTPRARELFEELQEGAAREGDALPCTNAPDLFFPDFEDAIGMKMLAEAKKACLSCPLVQTCAEYAFEADEKFGIWGGFSAGERRSIRYRYGRGNRVVA